MIKFGKEALICGQAEAEGSKIMNKATFFTCSTHTCCRELETYQSQRVPNDRIPVFYAVLELRLVF